MPAARRAPGDLVRDGAFFACDFLTGALRAGDFRAGDFFEADRFLTGDLRAGAFLEADFFLAGELLDADFFLAGAFRAVFLRAGDFFAALLLRAGAFRRAAFFAVFRRPFLAAIGRLPFKAHFPTTNRLPRARTVLLAVFTTLAQRLPNFEVSPLDPSGPRLAFPRISGISRERSRR